MSKGTIAHIRLFQEDRRISNFISNASLGINGAGVHKEYFLTYKPEEEVDEDRVMRALNKMIDQADAENSDFKISRPEVLAIYTDETP